jgi:hypothetical protein
LLQNSSFFAPLRLCVKKAKIYPKLLRRYEFSQNLIKTVLVRNKPNIFEPGKHEDTRKTRVKLCVSVVKGFARPLSDDYRIFAKLNKKFALFALSLFHKLVKWSSCFGKKAGIAVHL